MDRFPGLTFCMPSGRHIEPTFENMQSKTCCLSIEVRQSLLGSVLVAVLLCCTGLRLAEVLGTRPLPYQGISLIAHGFASLRRTALNGPYTSSGVRRCQLRSLLSWLLGAD